LEKNNKNFRMFCPYVWAALVNDLLDSLGY